MLSATFPYCWQLEWLSLTVLSKTKLIIAKTKHRPRLHRRRNDKPRRVELAMYDMRLAAIVQEARASARDVY